MSVRGWEKYPTTVLSGTASSVSITVSAEHTRFMVWVYAIKDANAEEAILRINGDSGANYVRQFVRADSTTVAGARQTGATSIDLGGDQIIGASSESLICLMISKPTSATVARVVGTASLLATNIKLAAFAGEWTNTSAAITAIAVLSQANNFASGTRVEIWGARR